MSQELPAHRVAFRVLLGASSAGAAAGLAALGFLVGFLRDASGMFEVGAVVGVGAATWAGLLLLAEAAALRVRPALRPLVITAAGVFSGLVVSLVLAWVWGIAEGKGPLRAWASMLAHLDDVAGRPREALRWSVALLVPFWLLGTVRTSGRPAWAQVPVAGAAGAAALLTLLFTGHDRHDAPLFVALLPCLPTVLVAGLWLGEQLEAKLMAWITSQEESS